MAEVSVEGKGMYSCSHGAALSFATNSSKGSTHPFTLPTWTINSLTEAAEAQNTVWAGLSTLETTLHDCICPYIKRIYLTKQTKIQIPPNKQQQQQQNPNILWKLHGNCFPFFLFHYFRYSYCSLQEDLFELINHNITTVESRSCGKTVQNPSSEGCHPIGCLLSPLGEWVSKSWDMSKSCQCL